MHATRTVLTALSSLLLLATVNAQSWDLAQDFSAAANPNGPWSFRFNTSTGVSVPCVTGAPPTLTGCTPVGWRQNVPLGRPIGAYSGVAFNSGTVPLTCTHNNPTITTIPPGAVVAHVGEWGTTIRWTAPAADTYRVEIVLAQANPSAGPLVYIDYNGVQVFPSNPASFFYLNSNGLTFVANFIANAPGDRIDVRMGHYLFAESTNVRVDMRVAPAALWNNFGTACGPSHPWIGGSARLTLGASSGVWVGGPPSTFGLLLLSFGAPGPGTPFGGCTLYVNPGPSVIGPFTTDSGGTWFLPIQVPTDPAWLGIEATFQGALGTNATASFWELTDGLYGRIGS